MPSFSVTGLGPGLAAARFGVPWPDPGIAAAAGGGSVTFTEPFVRAPR